MGFLDAFRTKESDPEIRRLEEMAKASKNSHEPYMELAVTYMAKVQTPPNWDDGYAKKAFETLQRARSIAQKHDPSQVEPIRKRFVETVHNAAMAYRAYYDEQPRPQWLNRAIWLFEQALPVADGLPDQIARIREGLSDCWMVVAEWYEKKLEDESTVEDGIQKFISASERAISYTDDESMRNAIDLDVSSAQFVIGLKYAQRADESAVLHRQDGKLLNVDDREHKAYAHQAIRLLRDGRARRKPFTGSEDYEELMASVGEILAGAYLVLYQLTWAHSKMSKSIGILEEGVEVVPDDPDLWATLARAYELYVSEVIDEYNSRPSINTVIDAADRVRVEAKVKKLKQQSLECSQRARKLAPDQY